ncbi:MAG: site-specific integrase [Treponema sp.]|nr:site-specific integrase [Treponema sp.]
MSNIPFVISRRKDSPYFYVRFKNESTGKYLPARSTGQTEKRQAEKTAWEWYKKNEIGKNQKQGLDSFYFQNEMRKADAEDLNFAIEELQRRGIIKRVIFADAKNAIPAADFLKDFWDWNKSKYIAEKLRKNHSIGKRHCNKESSYVKNYWLPFLKDKTLGELTKKDIEEFIDIVAKMDKSFCCKNDIVRAGTTAFKWAKGKELIDEDLYSNIIFFSGKNNERLILTPEIVQALFNSEWNDNRAKLANMLSMCTGLRAGEIQALRLQDLGVDRLYIKHSWNFQDGLKSTKNGEERTVYLPFPQIIKALKQLAESNPYGQKLNGFVFWATIPDKPMESKSWLYELRQVLKKLGVQDAEKYTFHAWRHFFSTYMLPKVNQKTLQKQTGHKTAAMLEHYAGHETTEDVRNLELAQIQTFGAFIQDTQDLNFDFQKMNKYIQVGYKD